MAINPRLFRQNTPLSRKCASCFGRFLAEEKGKRPLVKEAHFLWGRTGAKFAEPRPGKGNGKGRRLVQKSNVKREGPRGPRTIERSEIVWGGMVQSGPGKHAPEVKATEKRGFRAERGKFLRTLAIWRG